MNEPNPDLSIPKLYHDLGQAKKNVEQLEERNHSLALALDAATSEATVARERRMGAFLHDLAALYERHGLGLMSDSQYHGMEVVQGAATEDLMAEIRTSEILTRG